MLGEVRFWAVRDSGRGAARAEDAQGTPTQRHISRILVYADERREGRTRTFLEREGRTIPGLLDRKVHHAVQGYLAHTKPPPPLGPPEGPRHRPTVGSYGGGGSYERGTPVGAYSRHMPVRLGPP